MLYRDLADSPQTFIFELTDLYDKKNMPKVIYCIHVLRYAFVAFFYSCIPADSPLQSLARQTRES